MLSVCDANGDFFMLSHFLTMNLDEDHFDEDDPETCGGASSRSEQQHILHTSLGLNLVFLHCRFFAPSDTVPQLPCLCISFQKESEKSSLKNCSSSFLLCIFACIYMSSFYWFSSVSLAQFLLTDHLDSFLCTNSP